MTRLKTAMILAVLLMCCLRSRNHSCVWNAWRGGKREYHTENMAVLTSKGMLAAASNSPAFKPRTDFHLHRVPKEFYDLINGHCERTNLRVRHQTRN